MKISGYDKVTMMAWVAKKWAEATEHAESHCWNCDAEWKPKDYNEKCPKCGADVVPF